MPIDDCQHSFSDITSRDIPALLRQLDKSVSNPWTYEQFCAGKTATIKALSNDDKAGFPGCYVFFQDDQAIYTGISRNLPGRVWNHFNGKDHFQSSFIYKVARRFPYISHMSELLAEFGKTNKRQKDYHKEPEYQEAFTLARTAIQSWTVAHVRIDDPITLYLFEVAASMHFDTELNSFRTH